MSLAQARKLFSSGAAQAAKELAQQLLQRSPDDFEIHEFLGEIEERMSNYSLALEHFRRCSQKRPNHLKSLVSLARMQHRMGHSMEAIAICDRVLAVMPEHPQFLLQKATSLDVRNDYEAAWQTLQPVMAKPPVLPALAGLATRALYGLGRYAEAIEVGTAAANDRRGTPEIRRTLWLHVVKVCDKIGEYDQAMAACRAAHAFVEKQFDPAAYMSHVNDLLQTFNQRTLRVLARSSNTSQIPAFVIGMPRSGTSLVEQIIASHPMAHGAGEINDLVSISRSVTAEAGSMHLYPHSLADVTTAIADRLADGYLEHLRELGGGAARVTNKMLEQYEHVGLIWMLLPKARIVHVQRDPMDVCLSCFTRHLVAPYASSLEHLGLVYRQHERLMNHWKAVLDLPILTVQYEDIVANQEAKSREIIEFLGLPWDDRCLRYYESERTVMTLSYDQVNKPIYDSSIGRWKNYEKHLGPLKTALGLS